jgi:hypothetical protein
MANLKSHERRRIRLDIQLSFKVLIKRTVVNAVGLQTTQLRDKHV